MEDKYNLKLVLSKREGEGEETKETKITGYLLLASDEYQEVDQVLKDILSFFETLSFPGPKYNFPAGNL